MATESFFLRFITNQTVIAYFYSISLALKAHIIFAYGIKSAKKNWNGVLLLTALTSLMMNDLSWIVWALYKITWPATLPINKYLVLFLIRLAWAFYSLFYLSLTLLLENVLARTAGVTRYQKLLICIMFAIFILPFFGSALYNFMFLEKSTFESTLMSIANACLPFFLVPTTIRSLVILFSRQLPKILKRQITILLLVFIGPFAALDFIQYFFLTTDINSSAALIRPFIAGFSAVLQTTAMYFCLKNIFGIRFINFKEHVSETDNFNFIDDFRYVLEQLGKAINATEIAHITQSFFSQGFSIPYAKTKLIIRNLDTQTAHVPLNDAYESRIENFITLGGEEEAQFLKQTRILIYDEIVFSNFHQETTTRTSFQNFLESIAADIFLPIYHQQTIIAYIIVDRDARGKKLYTNIERDEMVVFASYLANIIYLMQHKNLNAIILKEQTMREELYHKHQEINQYKESIRSFLRSAKERKIGILFYKNRRFIFGNQAAQDFVTIDINKQHGHPLTKTIKHVSRHVEEYGTPQTTFAKDINGNRLVISCLPHLEKNSVIITIYYPEIADILKEQINRLQDPTEWDYLLYLETTQSGKLINQLVPGNTPTLLQFKVDLLKLALSKKTALLELPEEDLLPTVEIIHHISLRQQLHILKLQPSSKHHDVLIQLFGLNPLFDRNAAKPLLETLDTHGTLFIENIHFMDLETQNRLAEFIKSGVFQPYKSDQRIMSDVRIICSTNQNLASLVLEGKFSDQLHKELKKSFLELPSLLSMDELEFSELTSEYVDQAISIQPYKNFLELSEREKSKLIHQRPVSLQNLKNRIQTLLIQKSRKKDIYHETNFNPAYTISNPDLAEAARLGKNALKDAKIMAALWNKFKNQNKIATFLGVNRSSVNRRCKDFNLH